MNKLTLSNEFTKPIVKVGNSHAIKGNTIDLTAVTLINPVNTKDNAQTKGYGYKFTSANITKTDRLYIAIEADAPLTGRFSADQYYDLLDKAYENGDDKVKKTITKIRAIDSIKGVIKDTPTTECDIIGDTSGVTLRWFGQHDRNSNVTIVQRYNMRITTKPLDTIDIAIKTADNGKSYDLTGEYSIKRNSLIKYKPFNLPPHLTSNKVENTLNEFTEAASALLTFSQAYGVIVKGKDRTFVERSTGFLHSAESILLQLRALGDGILERFEADKDGNIITIRAHKWFEDFCINYLTYTCEKIDTVEYRHGTEDNIEFKNGAMVVYVKPYDIQKPPLVRLSNHDELVPLILNHYKEIEKILALFELQSRNNYDGVFKKTMITKIIGTTNVGKTYLFNDILKRLLHLFQVIEVKEILSFIGAGDKMSGVLGPMKYIKYKAIALDEAGLGNKVDAKKEAALADMYKALQSGLTGRGIYGNDATIYIPFMAALSRLEQLESTDELMNRDIEVSWRDSAPLVNVKREWIYKHMTQKEFKSVTAWAMYDICMKYSTMPEEELEQIISTFDSLNRAQDTFVKHKITHLTALFGDMIDGFTYICEAGAWGIGDDYASKYVTIPIFNHSHNLKHESFAFTRKLVGSILEDIRGSIRTDANTFMSKYIINITKTTYNNMPIYRIVPVWMSVIADELGIIIPTTLSDNLLEVNHSKYWDIFMGMSLEELADKLSAIFKNKPEESYSLDILRDLYTAIAIKVIKERDKIPEIKSEGKVDLENILCM